MSQMAGFDFSVVTPRSRGTSEEALLAEQEAILAASRAAQWDQGPLPDQQLDIAPEAPAPLPRLGPDPIIAAADAEMLDANGEPPLPVGEEDLPPVTPDAGMVGDFDFSAVRPRSTAGAGDGAATGPAAEGFDFSAVRPVAPPEPVEDVKGEEIKLPPPKPVTTPEAADGTDVTFEKDDAPFKFTGSLIVDPETGPTATDPLKRQPRLVPDGGQIVFDTSSPERFTEGVEQAFAKGLLPPTNYEKIKAQSADIFRVVDERKKLEEKAQSDPRLLAILQGLGRGGAMTAGAVGGAKLGAAAGAAGAAATGVGVAAAPVVAAVTGTLGAIGGGIAAGVGYDAAYKKLAEHFEQYDNVMKAAELYPMHRTGGELSMAALALPVSGVQAAQGLRTAYQAGGAAQAARMAAGAAGAGAGTGVVAYPIDAAVRGEEITPAGMATAAALGAATGGFFINNRMANARDVAAVAAKMKAGQPLTAAETQLARAAQPEITASIAKMEAAGGVRTGPLEVEVPVTSVAGFMPAAGRARVDLPFRVPERLPAGAVRAAQAKAEAPRPATATAGAGDGAATPRQPAVPRQAPVNVLDPGTTPIPMPGPAAAVSRAMLTPDAFVDAMAAERGLEMDFNPAATEALFKEHFELVKAAVDNNEPVSAAALDLYEMRVPYYVRNEETGVATFDEGAFRAYEDYLLGRDREFGQDMTESGGVELLAAVMELGGLPSRQAAGSRRSAWAGELEMLLQHAQGAGKGKGSDNQKGVFLNKLFRKDAKDLDDLVTGLQGKGFRVETPQQLIDMLDMRLRTGNEVYGVPTQSMEDVPLEMRGRRATRVAPGPAVNPYRSAEGGIQIPFRASSNFDPNLQQFEDRMRAVVNDPAVSDDLYNQIPDSKGGKVIGTDIYRNLLPEYAQGREGRINFVNATGRVAQAAAKDRLWREINNRGERRVLLFTAGGVAAGKSTAVTDDVVAEADLVFDGTLRETDWAKQTIQQALDNGWEVEVRYVQRPLKLVAQGAIRRAQQEGRWGPYASVPETHLGAQRSVVEIAKTFKGNPNARFKFYLNEGTSVTDAPKVVSLKDIDTGGKYSYATSDERVSERQDRIRRPDRSGVGAESQQPAQQGQEGRGGGPFAWRVRGYSPNEHLEVFQEAARSGDFEPRILRLLAAGNPALEQIVGAPAPTELRGRQTAGPAVPTGQTAGAAETAAATRAAMQWDVPIYEPLPKGKVTLRLHHGTWRGGYETFAEGTHFSRSKDYASRYMSPSASSMGISGLKEATRQEVISADVTFKKVFDTRNPEDRLIFEQQFLGKFGTGTPIGERGLPDWTDAVDLAEFLEERFPKYDGLVVDEGAEPLPSGEIRVRPEGYVPLKNAEIKIVGRSPAIQTGGVSSDPLTPPAQVRSGGPAKVPPGTPVGMAAINPPDWVLAAGETSAGRRLIKGIENFRPGQRWGFRSIVDFVNEAVRLEMRRSTTQTTRTHPAHYKPAHHMAYTRETQSQINFHEAGHGLEYLVRARVPDFFNAFADELLALANRPGSMASDAPSALSPAAQRQYRIGEGVAEWTRLFLVDPAAVQNLKVTAALGNVAERFYPGMGKALRDAARAVNAFQAADVATRWAMFNAVPGAKPSANELIGAIIRGGESAVNMMASGAPVSALDRKITRAIIKQRKETETAYGAAVRKARETRATNLTPLMSAYNMILSIGAETQLAISGQSISKGLRIVENDGSFRYLTHETWRDLRKKVPARQLAQFDQAAWAKESLNRYENGGLEYPGMREGISPKDLKAIVAAAEREIPNFTALYKEQSRFHDLILEVKEAGGLISPEDRAAMQSARDGYWPLPRVMTAGRGRGGRGRGDISAGVFRARGSGEAIRNIDEVTEERVREMFEAYYWNRFGTKLYDNMLKVAGDKSLPIEARKLAGSTMVKLKMPMQSAAKVSREEALGWVMKAIGDAYEKVLGFRPEVKAEDVNLSWSFRDVWRPVKPTDVNVVSLLRDGKREYYQIGDPAMFALFSRPQEARAAGKFVSWAVGPLTENWKRNITQGVVFAVRNMFRDVFTQPMMNPDPVGWVPGWSHWKGAVNKWTQKYPQVFSEGLLLSRVEPSSSEMVNAVKHGAVWQWLTEGFYVSQAKDPVVRTIMTVLQPSNWLFPLWKTVDLINLVTGGKTLAQFMETAGREGAAVAALQRGATDEEALAKYWTAAGQFNEHAGNADARIMMRVPGFLNPMLQGLRNQMQKLTDPDPVVAGTTWLRLLAMMPLAFGGAAIVRYMMMDDEEKEQERQRPVEDRMNFMNLGGFAIPFPFGVEGVMGSVIYNAAMDDLLSRPKVDADRTAVMMLKRIVDPGSGLQFFGPQLATLMEANMNWSSFRQKHIVAPWMVNLPASEQYYSTTPDFYRKVGQMMNYSPAKLQYIVQQAISRQADETIRLAESLDRGRPIMEAADVPFVGRMFVRDPIGFGSQAVRSAAAVDEKLRLLDERLKSKGWASLKDPTFDAETLTDQNLIRMHTQLQYLEDLRKGFGVLSDMQGVAKYYTLARDYANERNVRAKQTRYAQSLLIGNRDELRVLEQALELIKQIPQAPPEQVAAEYLERRF